MLIILCAKALGIVGARRRRVPKRSEGMKPKGGTPESPT